jgi:hypothetical protein
MLSTLQMYLARHLHLLAQQQQQQVGNQPMPLPCVKLPAFLLYALVRHVRLFRHDAQGHR